MTSSVPSSIPSLRDDEALKNVLGGVKFSGDTGFEDLEGGFRDYPPTRALVAAALKDVIKTLGIK